MVLQLLLNSGSARTTPQPDYPFEFDSIPQSFRKLRAVKAKRRGGIDDCHLSEVRHEGTRTPLIDSFGRVDFSAASVSAVAAKAHSNSLNSFLR